MILILGGTTEGRKAVQVVESAGKPYYYSTVGNEQAIEAVHAIRLTGGMDEEKMAQFCREKKISLLVDAAHHSLNTLVMGIMSIAAESFCSVSMLSDKATKRIPKAGKT